MAKLEFKDVPPNDLFMFGRQRLAEGDRDLAQEVFERVIQMVPNHSQALTLLGSISYQRGEDIKAEAFIDLAIENTAKEVEKQPRDMGLRASLANLMMARGRESEAETILAEVKLPIMPVRATEEEFEARVASAAAKGLPSVLINTVPKSASESIWNQLAESLGLGQGHISICLYPDCTVVPTRAAQAAGGGIIAKEHLPAKPHNLELLARHGFNRIVFHIRDPRQVVVSWAHFVRDDVSMRLMGPLWRKVVPPLSVLNADFEALLDWCVDNFLPLLISFIEGWQRVEADTATPLEVRFFSFERFLEKPERYFDDVLAFLEIDSAHFRRDAVGETVHLRKGQKEEWREVLSRSQQKRAWNQIPGALAEAHGWRA